MATLGVMLPLVYGNYPGEIRQKVGKMYNTPLIGPTIRLVATKNFVEFAQKPPLYEFFHPWDTDFIISSGYG